MQQSLDSFKKALTLLEANEKEILIMDIHVRGKVYTVDVGDLLCLGADHKNPDAVSEMMDKLPKMLVFFSEVLRETSESLVALEEDKDIFRAEKTLDALVEMTRYIDAITDVDGKKIPATLKKAPTGDQIQGWIITHNKDKWDELTAKISHVQSLKGTLENLVKGIESRLKFLDSEMRNATAQIKSGM